MQSKRNKPGTKISDFNQFEWQGLDEMDSLFNVWQYIQQVNKNPKTEAEIYDKRFNTPMNQDQLVWVYEYLRYFCTELNFLIPAIEFCECDSMVAGEWKFLCSAHSNPQECSAVNYIIHTLDGTTALLNSSKIFPSRVAIDKEAATYFANVSRRLYRIFAHVFFHHKDAWTKFQKTHDDFVKFCEIHDLVGKDSLIVPYHEKQPQQVTMERSSILK
eukprot:NODE_792_length_3855_cov_0.702688.p3 type:complete len:216 gc:universal NODE_792_length_3855_cov_0.702688:1343-696(-)